MISSLILASNTVRSNRPYPTNDIPRQDYLELAKELNAQLLGYDDLDSRLYRQIRHIEKRLKLDAIEALNAARIAQQHNVILSLSEKIAIPLSILMQMQSQKIPHVVIGHKLSSGLKTRLFKFLRASETFAHMICLCQAQVNYAVKQLGMPQSRVHFIYNSVDHRFFSPVKAEDSGYILSVGQEQRDYQTLLKAIQGTGIKLIVVASSPWSTSQVELQDVSNVQVLNHIPYTQLRTLYAGARLVVIPLHDVDYAAGVNAALEGMAMAKPVIVTHTPGIDDYIIDQETGVYVPSNDPAVLRETMIALYQNITEQQRLGANARQAVQDGMNLDHYVTQIADIMQTAVEQPISNNLGKPISYVS